MTELSRRAFLAAGSVLLAHDAVAQSGELRRRAEGQAAADHAVPSGAARRRAYGRRTYRPHRWQARRMGEASRNRRDTHADTARGSGFQPFLSGVLRGFSAAGGGSLPYLYYDQLGCGFSEAPDNATLWTLDRYREEVEQVRKALGLERFILFGHSWGGLLGMEYALYYPHHLRALVISNMTASVAEYVKYAEVLMSRVPPAARAVIQFGRPTAINSYDHDLSRSVEASEGTLAGLRSARVDL